jgi:choline dehydrogenase-like flavoprotein
LTGTLKTLTAGKELILSAGSIGTPAILQYSGIGDAKALTDLGIKSLVDLPSVGKNLTGDSEYSSISAVLILSRTSSLGEHLGSQLNRHDGSIYQRAWLFPRPQRMAEIEDWSVDGKHSQLARFLPIAQGS